jgi:glycosyltransferase involved in cell wall biosynthesis
MPTLLMLSYHFPPSAASGAFRLLGFARHLPKFGWNTVVVAPPGLPWEPSDPTLAARVPPETVVYHVPYPRRAPKVLRWLAPYTVWLPYARRAARRAVRKHHPDVVLTSAPPHWIHLLGRYFQKHFELPWVADFRDPWITASFYPEARSWRRNWELFWERRVMHNADLVLHNAPRACAAVQAAYPHDANRMAWLTNGFDPEDFPRVEQHAPGGVVRILHAGQLYVGRDPRPLLDAIGGIPTEGVPPFRVEFLGRTEYLKGADLAAEVRQRGLDARVLCRGQMSYQESLTEMCQADILLLLDTPGRKIGVPAKLYEYLGAGRPILATAEDDGDMAAILRESGVPYRLAPTGDVPRIRQALLDTVNGVAGGQMHGSADVVRQRFSREALAGKLAEMLNAVKSQHEASRRQ